jgi:hypothetical protein|tara:strand:- start:1831 stop:1965 length:135 start_codon:yes stop_codon:yes gene_type:complete
MSYHEKDRISEGKEEKRDGRENFIYKETTHNCVIPDFLLIKVGN